MDYKGKEADISAMFMNSVSAMIIEANVAGIVKTEYLEIDDAIEYKPNKSTTIRGAVKSAISMQSEDGEIITIPQNSTIKRLSDNLEGITTLNENDNLDILYNALDQQTFTNIVNGDGFISTNKNDITTTLNSMNINLTPQNGIIDGLAFSIKADTDILIDRGNDKPRIDLIVLSKNQSNRTIEIDILKGEPNDSPEEPEYERTSFGLYELPIFKVYVDINQTDLSRLNITDLRKRTRILHLYDSLIGMIFDYAGNINSLPDEYTLCDGRELSRTGKYSKLFDKIGTIWGAGNGISTFNLPDGCGAVAKGAGSSTKYDFNENRGEVGSYQNTAIKNITGSVNPQIQYTSNIGVNSWRPDNKLFTETNSYRNYGLQGNIETLSNPLIKQGYLHLNASRVVPVGQTNRDNNFAVLKVIYIGE